MVGTNTILTILKEKDVQVELIGKPFDDEISTPKKDEESHLTLEDTKSLLIQ